MKLKLKALMIGIALVLTPACSSLLERIGLSDTVVSTAKTAEDVLCVANDVGLPFVSDHQDSWFVDIISSYCAISAGYKAIGLVSPEAENRRATACASTLPEKVELTEEHSAYITAWNEVCDV